MGVRQLDVFLVDASGNNNDATHPAFVQLTAGTAVLGVVSLTPANSVGPTNATSTALEASRIIKASAGNLWGVSGFNSKSSAQYIQLFNSATLPADASVPTIVIQVPASTPFSIVFNSVYGRAFSTGIVICNSSTLATKTIGSADCWFDAQYT